MKQIIVCPRSQVFFTFSCVCFIKAKTVLLLVSIARSYSKLRHDERRDGTMKIALAIVFVVALCSHVSVVTCAPSSALAPQPALTGALAGTVTTTTKKPWSQKFKDGLGTFFQGAAVVGAVQQGFQNARSHKHKSSPAASLAPAAKH